MVWLQAWWHFGSRKANIATCMHGVTTWAPNVLLLLWFSSLMHQRGLPLLEKTLAMGQSFGKYTLFLASQGVFSERGVPWVWERVQHFLVGSRKAWKGWRELPSPWHDWVIRELQGHTVASSRLSFISIFFASTHLFLEFVFLVSYGWVFHSVLDFSQSRFL